MSVVAIRIAKHECRTISAAGAVHQTLRCAVNSANVLTIYAGGLQAESGCPRENIAGSGFHVMRVFVVEIVFANVDHRKLEQLGEVHLFIEHALAERAFSEKTYGYAAVTQSPRRKRGSGRNAGAAADDCIRPQIAGGRVCNVHGTTFALAVPGLLTQQFGEHSFRGGAFRQTMSVTAMSARNVVGLLKRFAYAHCDRFFSDVEVRQARHQRARVKFVDLRFELA